MRSLSVCLSAWLLLLGKRQENRVLHTSGLSWSNLMQAASKMAPVLHQIFIYHSMADCDSPAYWCSDVWPSPVGHVPLRSGKKASFWEELGFYADGGSPAGLLSFLGCLMTPLLLCSAATATTLYAHGLRLREASLLFSETAIIAHSVQPAHSKTP